MFDMKQSSKRNRRIWYKAVKNPGNIVKYASP